MVLTRHRLQEHDGYAAMGPDFEGQLPSWVSKHAPRRMLNSSAIVAVLLACSICRADGAPRRQQFGERGKKNSNVDSESVKSLLDLTPNLNDPHSQGFIPRKGPDEGGDIWDFGFAHALLHHVLENTPAGNPAEVAEGFHKFSSDHALNVSFDSHRGSLYDLMLRRAARVELATDSMDKPGLRAGIASPEWKALNVLVLGASLGGRSLRLLPTLISTGNPAVPHELISVESDPHLSSGGSQLVMHALGEDESVRHTDLIPGEDTTFHETIESLQNGYEFSTFDVVLLGHNDRALQLDQLNTLLKSRALKDGAIIHAEGPAEGDEGTDKYLNFLRESRKARFEHEVHKFEDGAVAISATLRHGGDNSEL